MSTQQKQKTKKKAKAKNGNAMMIAPGGSLKALAAPANIGVQIPRMGLRMAGVPQQLTDRGESIGIRLVGTDLYTLVVGADGKTNSVFGTNGSIGNVTPSGVSPRLEQFEELFQFYAFRKFKITYTNDVGSNTAGSLALALQTNPNAAIDSGSVTMQEVLEFPYSRKTAVWEPCEMFTYQHTGTRTWLTTSYQETGDPDEYTQAALLGVFNDVLAEGSYGTLFVEYVVDFYQPTPPSTTDPALAFRRLARRLKRKGKIGVLRDLCRDYLQDVSRGSELDWEDVKFPERKSSRLRQ